MTKVHLKPSGHEAAKSFYESLLSWTCFVGWSTSALVRLDQESRKSRKRPSKTRDISKDLRRFAHPGLTRLLVCEGLTDCWIAMDGHRCVATQHSVDLQYLSLKPSNTAACGPSIHHHGDSRPPGLQIEIKGNPWMMTFFHFWVNDVFLERIYNFGIWKSPDPTSKNVFRLAIPFGSPRWTLT